MFFVALSVEPFLLDTPRMLRRPDPMLAVGAAVRKLQKKVDPCDSGVKGKVLKVHYLTLRSSIPSCQNIVFAHVSQHVSEMLRLLPLE